MKEAIIAGIVTIVVCLINNSVQLINIKKASKAITEAELKATKLGIQALLRDRLYWTYNHYNAKGYAPIYARENFENLPIEAVERND